MIQKYRYAAFKQVSYRVQNVQVVNVQAQRRPASEAGWSKSELKLQLTASHD